MASPSLRVGMIIHSNSVITDVGSLCSELKRRGVFIILFANGDTTFKPHYNPQIHPEHLASLEYDKIVWYRDTSHLAEVLQEEKIDVTFSEEAIPFVYDPDCFKERSYKIFNIVHSVDNLYKKAKKSQTNIIDLSFVPFEKYGEYLDWDKADYVALGLPKYDVIASLDPVLIRKKYQLPEKYILVLVPNNNLLNWFVIYRIVRELKRAGYKAVLKGKHPKCDKEIYRLFSHKYFLSEHSFYPFVTHELIAGSSGVIGFDTTAIEEILMCERPFVNFSVKPYRASAAEEGNFKQFVPMWQAPFCLDIPFFDFCSTKGLWKPLPSFIDHFKKTFDYKMIQRDVFREPGGASVRIADFILQKLETEDKEKSKEEVT